MSSAKWWPFCSGLNVFVSTKIWDKVMDVTWLHAEYMVRPVNIKDYRKVSNIRRTKSQNSNASRLILEFSLPNPLKPGVKLRMKM